MSNFAILSILPFLGILFIAWRLLRVAKSTSNRINWTQRLNKWVLCIYVAILLLAAVVYELILVNRDEVIPLIDYAMLQSENELFLEAFHNNEESKFDPKFLLDEWTLELGGDTLEIISNGSNFPTERLNIEWTDSKDQLVEAKMYRTNLYRYGMNLEEEIPVSRVEIKDDQIILTAPPEKELIYYRFSNELEALSIDDSLDYWGQRRVPGDNYIYLKVPKHINVIDKDGLLIY